MMSVRPALGWLALLLFATSAQAEGARDFLKLTSMNAAPVTRKTKASPIAEPALVRTSATVTPALVVVEKSGMPRIDYEADGAVTMVFEKQRRPSFRLTRDHIRREVRLETSEARRGAKYDHVDVIDADEGIFIVDSVRHADGFASDVYAFARGSTVEERTAELAREDAPTRIREALVAAEWSKVPVADR